VNSIAEAEKKIIEEGWCEMDVAQTLKEISQGLGGKKHADDLHELLQLWLNKMNKYKKKIKKLKKKQGFYLGTWEEYCMFEDIRWACNEPIDGIDDYTGWVLSEIVRPGKYQDLALGKKIRIIVGD